MYYYLNLLDIEKFIFGVGACTYLIYLSFFSWGVYSVSTLEHILKPLEIHLSQTQNAHSKETVKYLTQKHADIMKDLNKFLEGREYICDTK